MQMRWLKEQISLQRLQFRQLIQLVLYELLILQFLVQQTLLDPDLNSYFSITFVKNSESAELQIPIEDDEVDEADGFIYVEILAPTLTEDGKTEYKVGTTNYRAKVHVSDDDEPAPLPVISISTQTESVEEGDNIQFSVSSSLPITGELVLDVNLSQTNSVNTVNADYIIGSLTRQITLSSSSPSKSFTILTQDDEVDESDGIISASITSGSNYQIDQSSSVNVAIVDDDMPVVSVRPTNATTSVVEGTTISFTVEFDKVSWQPIKVNVNTAQTHQGTTYGDFILPADRGTSEVEFAIGRRTKIVTVRTIDDEVDETVANIRATILAGSHYQVYEPIGLSTKSYYATVQVLDDDEPVAVPHTIELSISPVYAQISEGELAAFSVNVSESPQETTLFSITVSDGNGDFIKRKPYNPSYPQVLRINPTATGYFFSIPTENDRVDEEDGAIIATLLPGEGYTIESGKESATVIVADNDEPTPNVSISRVNDTIQEGDEASFLVRIDRAINSDLDVKVGVNSDINNTLLSTQVSVETVRFIAGETSQLLVIPTQGNDVDGPDSKVTATLHANERYLLPANESDHADSITVLDDDVPLVSIIAEADSISEGGIARFGVTTEVEVVEAVTVSVVVNQTGDVISGGSGIETVHFAVGSDSKVIDVQTSEDEIDEIEGRIMATIIEPNDGKYLIGEKKTASVVVTDNDDPILSIAPVVVEPITEGEVVQFTITARDREVESELRINTNINQSSNFMTWRIPRITIMPTGKKITTIVISTIDDNKVQEDGEFTAEILTGEGYRISSQNIATVSIEDNDTDTDGDSQTGTNNPRIAVADKIMEALLETAGVNQEPAVAKPEISIVARNDEVAEGEVIRFAIQSSLAPDADLIIEISIDSPNDSISEPTPMRIALQAGSSTHVLELATSDDNEIESNEVITLTINEQPTYTVSDVAGSASVIITDHKDWQRHNEIARANSVVIPELAGRLSAQSLNQIVERIQQGFTGEGQNVLQIAGNEELTGILEQSGDAVNNDAPAQRYII